MGDIGAAVSGALNYKAQREANFDNYNLGIANLNEQKKTNEYNRQMRQQEFEYQKQLNETQMKREDTAIQRQAADYQAAGFNRLMATEQGGASSSALTTYSSTPETAAQNNYLKQAEHIQFAGSMIESITNFMQTVEERKLGMEKTREEINLMKGQIDYQNTENEINKINKLLKDIELEEAPLRKAQLITDWLRSEKERLRKIKDYEYWDKLGLPEGGGVGWDNEINSLINQLESGNIDKIVPIVNKITGQLGTLAEGLGKAGVEAITNTAKGAWKGVTGKIFKFLGF